MAISLAGEKPEVRTEGVPGELPLVAGGSPGRPAPGGLLECQAPPQGLGLDAPHLENVPTFELKGILAGASRAHDDMIRDNNWRTVTPP
jgi:hypothetical protein